MTYNNTGTRKREWLRDIPEAVAALYAFFSRPVHATEVAVHLDCHEDTVRKYIGQIPAVERTPRGWVPRCGGGDA